MLNRKDIAEMLGIRADTFRKCVESRPDFPKPALRLSQKMVLWNEVDVQDLAKISGHKDVSLLVRVYYRATPKQIASRLG